MSYQIPRVGLNPEGQRRIADLQRRLAEDQVEMLAKQGAARTAGIEGTYGKIGDGITAAVEGYHKGEKRAEERRKAKRAEDDYAADAPVRDLTRATAKHKMERLPTTLAAEDAKNEADLAYTKAKTDDLLKPDATKIEWVALGTPDQNGNTVFYNKSNPSQQIVGPKMGVKPGEGKKPEDLLSLENKLTIEGTAKKNVDIRTAQAGIKSALVQFQNAKTDDDKVRIGRQMLKNLNSLVSADAIGVEEANRLGSALETQVFNMRGPGPMFGRDLAGFETQVNATLGQIDNTLKTNENIIEQAWGRAPKHQLAQPAAPKEPPESGTAIAAPARRGPSKPLEQMTDAELDAYEASLKGAP